MICTIYLSSLASSPKLLALNRPLLFPPPHVGSGTVGQVATMVYFAFCPLRCVFVFVAVGRRIQCVLKAILIMALSGDAPSSPLPYLEPPLSLLPAGCRAYLLEGFLENASTLKALPGEAGLCVLGKCPDDRDCPRNG